MNKKQVLAFDFGGGSGRAILGRLEDGRILMEEARQIIAASETTCEYLPQDCEKWNAAYEKFKTYIQD